MVVWAALFSEGGAISTMPVERPTISTSSCSQRNQLLSTGPLKQRAILLFRSLLGLCCGPALLCTLGDKPLQCQPSWRHLVSSAEPGLLNLEVRTRFASPGQADAHECKCIT